MTDEERLHMITEQLLLVRDNLFRGMSKSIQKLQARSINEVLELPNFTQSPHCTSPIPLHIEDEYVRNYLWERALIAIDDPCCRSHPHENMNEYCQRRTELARYQAKLKEKNNG